MSRFEIGRLEPGAPLHRQDKIPEACHNRNGEAFGQSQVYSELRDKYLEKQAVYRDRKNRGAADEKDVTDGDIRYAAEFRIVVLDVEGKENRAGKRTAWIVFSLETASVFAQPGRANRFGGFFPCRFSVSIEFLRGPQHFLPLAREGNGPVESQLRYLLGDEADQKHQHREHDQHLRCRAVSSIEHEDFVEAVANARQKGNDAGGKEDFHRRKEGADLEDDEKKPHAVAHEFYMAFAAGLPPCAFIGS